MKIYIVHPQYDYAVEELFTTRELAEQHMIRNLDGDQHYIEEREVLDHIPDGGNRYERWAKEHELP